MSKVLRMDCGLLLLVCGVLAAAGFGVDGAASIRTDRRFVFTGESGECISSGCTMVNPAVNCSILSSKESKASNDSSKFVDEVLLKGVRACKLFVDGCEASCSSVVGRLNLDGDRLFMECTKESSVALAPSVSEM